MKNCFKIISIIVLIILAGCTSEKIVDQVFNSTTSGAALRTISSSLNVIFNDPSSAINLTLEEQDETQGDIFQEMDVYVSFIDNTNDGVDNAKAEALFTTIPRSSFTTNARQLPEIMYSATVGEITTALGLATGQFVGGDQFGIRFSLKLADGREFSSAQGNSNITGGSYFSSPYQYRVNLICAFDESLAGDHTYVSTMLVAGPGGGTCPSSMAGTVTWTEVSEGLYSTSDHSFGLFESSCWDDAPAASGSSMVNWFCSKLEALGTDQYGDSYTYTITSVNGSDMTIEFVNTYGDGGTTVLTRAGGVAWPALFQ